MQRVSRRASYHRAHRHATKSVARSSFEMHEGRESQRDREREKKRRTFRRINRVRRPLWVIKVLCLVPRVADEARPTRDELVKEGRARLDQALDDAPDRVLAGAA